MIMVVKVSPLAEVKLLLEGVSPYEKWWLPLESVSIRVYLGCL
jgi:hypothetical protein